MLWSISIAQRIRLMFMKNKNKIVYYESEDELSFTIKGSRTKIKDRIRSFVGDSLIVFYHNTIDVRSIDGIYLDKKNKVWYFLKYKYDKLLFVSGAGLLLLELINTGHVDEKAILIGSSLMTAGILAKLLISKRLKIKGKKLKILNL